MNPSIFGEIFAKENIKINIININLFDQYNSNVEKVSNI